MTPEAPLILLLCASVAVGAALVRRPDASPVTCWVAGWISSGAGTILLMLRNEFPHSALLAYPLGTLFPALLLSGALLFAGRAVPRWLLPAAAGFGGLRAGVAAAGHPELAWASALVVEPAMVLTAAWVVRKATPRNPPSLSQRLLAPSLVVLAGVGLLHVAWMLHSQQLPSGLLAIWVVAVPSLFGVQIHAEWERARRTLQHAREQLEARVDARTAELARVNASLRESEARQRIAAELGSDLSFGFRVDRHERLHEGWISDAFPRLTGYSIRDLARIGWVGVVHPEDRAGARSQFAEIAADRLRELEFRIVTRDGSVRRVHGRLRVEREGSGDLRVVGAARDVTETRRAEEERRQLELQVLEAQRLESLAVLAGGVAHDFNNLLLVILGNSRVALAETPAEAPISARLLRIRAAAEHGARLTEQMLAYSGKSSLALKPLDLSQLVEEMADLLCASVSERCRLELETVPHTPVEGDATQLQQVLLNLVTNASEALPDGAGSVRVRTGSSWICSDELASYAGSEAAAPGRYSFVEVHDDGAGMDAATQARIFEPFFSTKFSGRGLGLAAVLGIVRAHRGVMHVHSRPGAGTTLRLCIPEARNAVARPRAGAEPAQRQPATLLVVDDHESVLELAQIVLEAAGHRVITALGGRAGIERYRAHAHEIDAVLLDLGMPDTDGEEVLRELQQLRSDVRVIIATGYAAEHASERIRARGVAGFVRKPYEPEALLDQVARALAGDA